MECKIIFLDFDGPMIPLRSSSFRGNKFDPVAVAAVNYLAQQSGAKFVISSNWALYGKERVLSVLKDNGIDLDRLHNDWTTPRKEDTGSWSRGQEVKSWVANHPEVTLWAAFDDEEVDEHHGILVTIEDGMLTQHIKKAARLLELDEYSI